MAANRYSVYPSSFVYAAGVSTLDVSQIINHSVRTNSSHQEVIPGGNLDRSAVVLVSADPMITFRTGDLKTVLDVVTITAGLNATNGATIRYQRRIDGGTFAGGATNYTLTSSKGFLYPTSITASQDDTEGAIVECSYVPLSSDGLADPVNETASVTFTTPVPAFNQVYHLGPVYHNAAEIEGVTRVTIDPGIQYRAFRGDGDVFATVGTIIRRSPTITVTTVNLDFTTTIAAQFNAPLAGTLACYFWKATAGGSRVAAITAGHCKISAATGAFNADNFSVSDNGDGTFDINIMPTGTIAFSSASAIP